MCNYTIYSKIKLNGRYFHNWVGLLPKPIQDITALSTSHCLLRPPCVGCMMTEAACSPVTTFTVRSLNQMAIVSLYMDSEVTVRDITIFFDTARALYFCYFVVHCHFVVSYCTEIAHVRMTRKLTFQWIISKNLGIRRLKLYLMSILKFNSHRANQHTCFH